ncbi:acetoacetyl-synthase [Ilyonectria robusta]|uniref:acetoacetyl-synthase n=1 Tax=Ilyonectria robusta TaxID=1079257 RepID=UPI001E8DCA63|nr:acetoacetyl-synthase [Ilyonectria robusta]KAH8650771.1 acetoacetyl-synthase [Ilyonectria robusta]
MASHHSPRLLWQPREPSKTMLSKLRRFINQRHTLSLKHYHDLWTYSTDGETTNDFWVDLFIFLELTGDKVPQIAFAPNDGELLFPPPTWYPEVRLNFTEILLSNRDPSKIVLHACTEGGNDVQNISWETLISQVAGLADAMRSSGIVKGDRVGGVLSNRPETVVTCLATLSIGALWSTSSPDMGTEGVLDRLEQIRPKLLFVESDAVYGNKVLGLMEKNRSCARQMLKTPEFMNMVVIPRSRPVQDEPSLKLVTWSAFLKRGLGRPMQFERLPFNHPGFIVYSSGTTGPPKCIVHSAAGLLLQSRKDSVLHFDVQPGDNILQYTTTGWIMWGKVICGIGYGGRTVLYDGSPLKPDPLVLLRLISRLGITHFGTSARYLTELKNLGLAPRNAIDLSCLKCVISTGSTLTAEVSDWFYDVGFPPHVHLVSTCGGTDIAGSLVSGNPTLPLYSGEIQCETLGMATDIADADVLEPISVKKTGRAGELTCRRPFPSQPVCFWGDGDMSRYKSSYFEKYGNKTWYQGDFIQMNPKTGGFIMLGRSDGVLNPSGVRFGSAEVYEVVEKLPGIEDTLCVGRRRPHDQDEAVMLFVKMAIGQKLTRQLKSAIKASIRAARTPRHVPKFIFQVPHIPYTINGKKIEQAVKVIVSRGTSKANGAVANPESFDYFKQFYKVETEDEAEGIESKL